MLTKYGRVAGATIILSAALLTSACGSGANPSASNAPATRATTTTAAARVYSDKAGFIAAVRASTKDVTTVHMAMTMTGQGQEITMEGDSRVDPASPATRFTMEGSGLKLEMIVIDKQIYAKGLPGQDPTKWAVLDANSAAGKELSSSAGQLDPAKMYDEFDQALTGVKHVGTETVGGEVLNTYELTMDTASIADLPTQGAELPKTLTYTAWLDSKDRLRRMTFEILGMKVEVAMSKYGEPVDITAPPAAQTVKVPA